MLTIATQIAPDSLINPKGLPHFGHFDGIVKTLGLADFTYFDTMDKPASPWAKRFNYKQFQFVSLVTPRYVIGVALADIAYLGSAFCYVYDIKANRLSQRNWLKPLGVGYQMTPSPANGKSGIGRKGSRLSFDILEGGWRLIIDTKNLQADVTLHPSPLSLPMAMCSPTGYSGWTYTQKHNGLTVTGKLTVDHEQQPLNAALAGYDFSAGFMRRDTSWRWASINAQIDGGIMGLNLAAGVNETGANENVFWINGERHLLGPVQFEFDRHATKGTEVWRIYSHNGQVDLLFSARTCRSEKRNLILLKSNFRQYIGLFSGTIIDNAGRCHQLNNVLGLTEDHYARW
ncbi:DUF2804 domain-containing protein [Shewanella profunda]|uniref:DUF2804 domain-containing protein n=1 Tax=Shewanella profunda TaxID=254793 RepID=UPI00200BF142|nr:DUF2804 domain-containing protein [Shewanella profunda]MCL1088139.1 DUF2804 domain-containing protein [Shewanella profunda]